MCALSWNWTKLRRTHYWWMCVSLVPHGQMGINQATELRKPKLSEKSSFSASCWSYFWKYLPVPSNENPNFLKNPHFQTVVEVIFENIYRQLIKKCFVSGSILFGFALQAFATRERIKKKIFIAMDLHNLFSIVAMQ